MFQYDNNFGNITKEISLKQAQIKMLEHKYQLQQCYIEEGKILTRDTKTFIDGLIKQAQNRSEKKLDTLFRNKKSISQPDKISPLYTFDKDENIDISNIYRQIVKRLHPDIAGNGSQQRNC